MVDFSKIVELEKRFYKTELPEMTGVIKDVGHMFYAVMPDGFVYTHLYICKNQKSAIFMKADKEWRYLRGISEGEDIDTEYLRQIRYTGDKYTCISDLIPAADYKYNELWKSCIPTLEGFKACEYATMTNLCGEYIYGDLWKWDAEKIERIQITKKFSDYFVKYSKDVKYFKDCVLCRSEGGYWYSFTRQYGQYYFIGFLEEAQGESYRNPGYVEIPVDVTTAKTMAEECNKITKLQEIIKAKNNVIERLDASVTIKNETIKGMNRIIDSKDSLLESNTRLITRLKEVLREKDESISKLRHTIADDKGIAREDTRLNTVMETRIVEMDSKIKTCEERLKRMIPEKKATVEVLKNMLKHIDDGCMSTCGFTTQKLRDLINYLTK